MRYHTISGVKEPVPFTGDEEAEADAREAQAQIDKEAAADAARIAAIKKPLDANDVKIVRGLTEGDQDRIEAHKKKQAELRAKL